MNDELDESRDSTDKLVFFNFLPYYLKGLSLIRTQSTTVSELGWMLTYMSEGLCRWTIDVACVVLNIASTNQTYNED